MIRGIDISEMNGVIDFKKVKEDEIDFVMIRASFGRNKEDKMFRTNIVEARKNNLKVGVYYYSYALTVEQAKEEVANFLRVISPYKNLIKYPAVIDMEDSDGYKAKNGFPSNEVLSEIVKVACEKISEAGYYPLVYANQDYFKNKLTGLDNIGKWIAWWNVEKEKIDVGKYVMWQKSSNGIVNGIKTRVDINEAFVEFDKLHDYLENVKKIQFIKLRSGIEDLSIQFMSCYKFGQDLIDKVYTRLSNLTLVKCKDSNLHKVVQKEYGLEDKTRVYLEAYIYSEELFLKLYKAICEEKVD